MMFALARVMCVGCMWDIYVSNQSTIFLGNHAMSSFAAQDEVGVARDVFLYCKSDLRPGASVPEPETLPRISVDGEHAGGIHPVCTCYATSPREVAVPERLEWYRLGGGGIVAGLCTTVFTACAAHVRFHHMQVHMPQGVACLWHANIHDGGVVEVKDDCVVNMCAELAPSSIRYEAHPLDSVRSPLLQALPNFERRFRGHLRRGQAFQAAATARLAAAEQLIAEMVRQNLGMASVSQSVSLHCGIGAHGDGVDFVPLCPRPSQSWLAGCAVGQVPPRC